MPFEKGKSGNPKGRPKKNLVLMPEDITDSALEQLRHAVNNGESWAIQFVLKRAIPELKSRIAEGTPEYTLLDNEAYKSQKSRAVDDEFDDNLNLLNGFM